MADTASKEEYLASQIRLMDAKTARIQVEIELLKAKTAKIKAEIFEHYGHNKGAEDLEELRERNAKVQDRLKEAKAEYAKLAADVDEDDDSDEEDLDSREELPRPKLVRRRKA
jgi:hypothetical protein